MIEFEHVTKHYGERPAVQDVCLTVAEGETLVLLGTSGCGKTTCLKMVNRLIEPTTGVLRVFGEDITRQPPESLRRRIGYVIQNVGLFPHYTVRKNIATVPSLLGWSPGRIEARVDQLLEMVGLPPSEYAELDPRALSGGQVQRVGLARALAADPPIVLLDEPFGALDPITRGQMQAEFSQLQAALHKTLILVTHDIDEAVALGHRICLLNEGQVQQVGAPRDLLLHPSNEFVRRFFDRARLQLELRILTVSDLAPYLAPREERHGGRVYPASATLQDLLGDLSLGPDHLISAVLPPSTTGVTMTVADVLAAYHRYRGKTRSDA